MALKTRESHVVERRGDNGPRQVVRIAIRLLSKPLCADPGLPEAPSGLQTPLRPFAFGRKLLRAGGSVPFRLPGEEQEVLLGQGHQLFAGVGQWIVLRSTMSNRSQGSKMKPLAPNGSASTVNVCISAMFSVVWPVES